MIAQSRKTNAAMVAEQYAADICGQLDVYRARHPKSIARLKRLVFKWKFYREALPPSRSRRHLRNVRRKIAAELRTLLGVSFDGPHENHNHNLLAQLVRVFPTASVECILRWAGRLIPNVTNVERYREFVVSVLSASRGPRAF